ncbi:hypothetical protein MLD38_027249 [Melastoma candidum]|uniref:Uncharacterized protein n=1 Tax=Melastoma candidum TaxID=119954 RepID=A0ACB9P2S8_9MYRT|nr:hypothetical protein MLD38_027249 [Melastoma candidum]
MTTTSETTMTLADIEWPFDSLEPQEIRDTAYELFVAACRSLPSFTSRNKKTVQGSNGLMPSRIKKSLGLKAMSKPPIIKEIVNPGGSRDGRKVVRSTGHFTLAELMRQQMGVSERDDKRLHHMLMKTLAGQVSISLLPAGRRVETVILPLELIRNIMPSEFKDAKDYHAWQRRQLKILEVGLLLHPSIPLDKSNGFAIRLGDAIQASEAKAIDTGNNSDVMGSLINAVITLSWRSVDGTPSDTCHWADGYPLNIHLYLALLRSIFDIEEETVVLDEVDDLFELMKKTWYILGINRHVHIVCLSWVFFQRYIATNQTEPELLEASQGVLEKVVKDPKRPDNDPVFGKVFSAALNSMRSWLEERLLNYHKCFDKETVGVMDSMLPLALTVLKASGEDAPAVEAEQPEKGETSVYVDLFIQSSLKNAFAKVVVSLPWFFQETEDHASGGALITMAGKVESLAKKEADIFSPVLGKWHQDAAGLALVTLHDCYGVLLKQYLSDATTLNEEVARVLKRAQILEKNLIKMINENTPEGGEATAIKEMVPYDTEACIVRLVDDWIDKKVEEIKSVLVKAKETETWNPKSQTEAYAQSAADLVELVKAAVAEFKTIQEEVASDLNRHLVERLRNLFKDYISFVAECGSKQDYVPALPTLTRCHQDSKLVELCRKASCGANSHHMQEGDLVEGESQGPSTSRGTQRLYIRLNTLHYLLAYLQTLGESNGNLFDDACSSTEEELQHVSEVAAYRLIFQDSGYVLYDNLYARNFSSARFQVILNVLKQNLNLLGETLNEDVQALAVKDTMRASFDAYLRVLIAGGNSRVFNRADHKVVEENFEILKREFSSLPGETVSQESKAVEGIINLMGHSSEQLIEELTANMSATPATEPGKKLPVPPIPDRWSSTDPNTILRVLCHRNDRTAKVYLKKTFQLEKRR